MAKLAPEPQLAANTVRTYKSRRIMLGEPDNAPDVVDAVETLFAKNVPLGTALPTRAAALRTLMGMGITQGEANDMLPTVKGLKPKKMRFALTPEQLERYYEEVERLPESAIKVALYLLPQTGLRPEEICELRREHVREAPGGVEFSLEVHGKSKAARMVPLQEDGAAVLRAWLSKTNGDFVFPGRFPNKPMGTQILRAAICGHRDYYTKVKAPGIAVAIGVEQLTPYVLRHTYATGLLADGVGIETIAELLGHEDISTTQEYTHIENQALRDAARGRARKKRGGTVA